jgi:hypothetical protein
LENTSKLDDPKEQDQQDWEGEGELGKGLPFSPTELLSVHVTHFH